MKGAYTTMQWAGALIAFCVLSICLGCVLPIQFIVLMVGGWVMFLARVLPQVEVDGGAIALSAGALTLFVIGLHWLLRWFYAAVHREAKDFSPWRVRWTASIAVLTLLMFIAGISFVGVTHQVVWLATSEEHLLGTGTIRYRTESGNRLKNIALAVQSYQDKSEMVPAGATTDAEGRMLHSWMTLLLPHVEQFNLRNRITYDRPWDDAVQRDAFQTQVRVYQSPYPVIRETHDAKGRSLAHYSSNVRVIGGTAPRSLADLPDGAANTLIAGEAAGNYVPWGQPGNWRDPAQGINRSPSGFGSPNPIGAMFAFADGHVQMLTKDTSPEILKALATPAGGEVLSVEY